MAYVKQISARNASNLGDNYSAFCAMWKLIPEGIKRKLNGRELGVLVDLLWSQKEYGASQMYNELKHYLPPAEYDFDTAISNQED